MDNDKCWSVYMHTNLINGKKYVGITSVSPKKRWGVNGKGYNKNTYFARAIQKYGWDNFKHEILLTGETKEYACRVEKCLIKHYKSNQIEFGYNLTNGGDIGWNHSEDSKRKLSASRKGKYTGENSPMYGVSPKERMDEETYKAWLYKQQNNKPRGENHPMYGVSPQERMDEEAYQQWCEKLKDNKRSIPVMCIETKKKYRSAREAERETHIPHTYILNSCNSEDFSVLAGNFHWCYVGADISEWLVNKNYIDIKYIRCVENGQLFKTAREVERLLGCDSSSILKCCKGQCKTVYGYHWEYYYEHIEF